MPSLDPEEERLKKLRDRQIADRDPQVKQRHYQQNYSRKNRQRAAGQHLTLKSMWLDLPHVIRSSFIGLVLGLLTLWFLPQVWISRFAVPAGIAALVVFLMIGLVIGNALDVRDNIRDLSK
jgi:hypothetical protein